jgi:hypothetical protein
MLWRACLLDYRWTVHIRRRVEGTGVGYGMQCMDSLLAFWMEGKGHRVRALHCITCLPHRL